MSETNFSAANFEITFEHEIVAVCEKLMLYEKRSLMHL